MNILGLSAYYHDASAALVQDGRVLAAAAEERFTLQKHDPSFPKFAIAYCLKAAGLGPRDLDAIVFYERPHVKFARVFASALSGYPRSREAFVKSMKTWMGSKLWIQDEISRRLDVPPAKVEFAPHHLSHAAQAFAASPFDRAAVLVADAVGEWDCTSLWEARFGPGLELKLLEALPYPHSLGLVYAAFTAFLGFRVNDEECHTMALACFGRPVYAEALRRVLRPQGDGTYAVDPSYFAFDAFTDSALSSRFLQLFGAPRSHQEPLPFDALEPSTRQRASGNPQRYADAAASIQAALEEALLGLCRKLHARTGLDNLCLAGGTALNCVANERILRDSPFERVFIPPDPGDGGAALGAALYGYFQRGGKRAAGYALTPYLGQAYDPRPDLEMLPYLPGGWRLEAFSGFERLAASAVADLEAGRIVGWFRGRFENGPRALGNRSILLHPGRRDSARRLSRSVKNRASFRPYAFAVTAEQAPSLLPFLGAGAPSGAKAPGLPETARWMQASMPVEESSRERVAGALHCDGTSRPQVCTRQDNPEFHRLLELFGQASGTAALLNTSLNDAGLPLVSSPAEALSLFARTGMDTLVLENSVIRKAS